MSSQIQSLFDAFESGLRLCIFWRVFFVNDPVYTHGLTVGLIVGLSRCESMSSVSCDLIVAVVIHHPVLASPAVIWPPVSM